MVTGSDEEAFQRLRRAAKLTLYGGDCFNYGLLSSGLVDLVVEADLKPYDYLAQVPIIAGAGGVMTDWEGRPPGLESDGRVLCAGDRRCHELAISLLQGRSEEHTSELQSLMRISYAVFCLQKKNTLHVTHNKSS